MSGPHGIASVPPEPAILPKESFQRDRGQQRCRAVAFQIESRQRILEWEVGLKTKGSLGKDEPAAAELVDVS